MSSAPPESNENNENMVSITEEVLVESSSVLAPEDFSEPRISYEQSDKYERSDKVEIVIEDQDIHETLSEETPAFDASLLKDLTDSNIE
jgi:hypothetical protein